MGFTNHNYNTGVEHKQKNIRIHCQDISQSLGTHNRNEKSTDKKNRL